MVSRARGLGSSFDSEHELVLVAPGPVLPRLGRPDDRVARLSVVRGRVPVRAAVAAADLAADLAHPQVHPGIACSDALRAPGDLGLRLEVTDLVDVLTSGIQGNPSLAAALLQQPKAEGVGFEPTRDPKAPNGFRDRPVQPLRHPSEAIRESRA